MPAAWASAAATRRGGQPELAVGADQQAEGAAEAELAAARAAASSEEGTPSTATSASPAVQPAGYRDQRRGRGRLHAGQEVEHGGGLVGQAGRRTCWPSSATRVAAEGRGDRGGRPSPPASSSWPRWAARRRSMRSRPWPARAALLADHQLGPAWPTSASGPAQGSPPSRYCGWCRTRRPGRTGSGPVAAELASSLPEPGRGQRLDPRVDDHVRGAGQLRGDLGEPEVGQAGRPAGRSSSDPGRRLQLVVEQPRSPPGIRGMTKRPPGRAGRGAGPRAGSTPVSSRAGLSRRTVTADPVADRGPHRPHRAAGGQPGVAPGDHGRAPGRTRAATASMNSSATPVRRPATYRATAAPAAPAARG